MQTDYDLVVSCKAGKTAAYETLFTRYRPFLSKKYYSTCKGVFGFGNVYEFSDFLSEGYIALTKAVKYVNIEKITDTANWKFLGVYMWFVSTMRTKLVTTLSKQTHSETPILTQEDFQGESSAVVEFESPTISPEQALCEKDSVRSFYDSLTPYESIIVAERCLTDSENNPKPIMKIAKQRGEPFSKVQHTCKKIEAKFAACV